MPNSRSQASRLNHLLFEVVAIAPPQVAYSFVTKSLPALHTFDRAGGVAGTRRATKSQSSRCSYLSENVSIRTERGSVSKVEIDWDACHTGPHLRSLS